MNCLQAERTLGRAAGFCLCWALIGISNIQSSRSSILPTFRTALAFRMALFYPVELGIFVAFSSQSCYWVTVLFPRFGEDMWIPGSREDFPHLQRSRKSGPPGIIEAQRVHFTRGRPHFVFAWFDKIQYFTFRLIFAFIENSPNKLLAFSFIRTVLRNSHSRTPYRTFAV